MRILLLGDYSGLFKNLKAGLEELGDEITLLTNGDGWKNIPGADGKLLLSTSGMTGRVCRVLQPLFDKRLYKGYDAVGIINLSIFHPWTIKLILDKLSKNNNKKLFLSACGGDYAVYYAYKHGVFEYYVYDENPNIRYSCNSIWREFGEKEELCVINKYFSKIIPIAYEYRIGYTLNNIPITPVIPIPINIKEIKYEDNIVKEKVVIFHGINREIPKGTKYIRQALNDIAKEYPNQVEVIIDGHMPYEKYVQVMKRANIVIDQCKSYGYGVNACIAMAQGKIVLSGAKQETLNDFSIKREECPVIPIGPDVEMIKKQLIKLIHRKDEFIEFGRRNRKYIEKYHNYVEIAKIYKDIIKQAKSMV